MMLFCRNLLISLLFFTTAFAASIFYEEPALVNSNLRLAAMGDIDFIIEEYDNEINMYDFGQLPSGAIDDDSGRSSCMLTAIYGVDGAYDNSSATEWLGGSLGAKGIYKHINRWAIGGSFKALRRELGFYSPTEMSYVRWDIRMINDSIVLAVRPFKSLLFGFRGAYCRNAYETIEYINYRKAEDRTWIGEPSLSIILMDNRLSAGVGYAYTDGGAFTFEDKTRTWRLPVIYSGRNLTLGCKLAHKLYYRRDGFTSMKDIFGGLQALYKVPINSKVINIGILLSRKITYDYYEFTDPTDKWYLHYGFGIAFIDVNLVHTGVQFQQIWYRGREAAHLQQTIFNLGFESNKLKRIPIRLGFVFHSWDPETYYFGQITQSMLTAGFGVLITHNARVDFAYNLRVADKDLQNIAGLSARFTF